jgi:drug/metabolite transporter (DMT)-like permease
MKTPLNSILLVLAASFIGSIGAGFLKAGSGKLHSGLKYLILNGKLALGVFFFCASSVLYVFGLRQGTLSVLYPMVSLSYVWAMLWSRLFLNEQFTRKKLYGVCLIAVGIAFIGLGNR